MPLPLFILFVVAAFTNPALSGTFFILFLLYAAAMWLMKWYFNGPDSVFSADEFMDDYSDD